MAGKFEEEQGRKAEEWLKRTAPAFKKKLDPSGMHLRRPSGQNPLVRAFNEALKAERRRKLN